MAEAVAQKQRQRQRQKLSAGERSRRIAVASQALQCFAADTEIVDRPRGLAVRWQQWGQTIEKRWQLQSGSCWYPVWYRHWGHGGTATTALANLIRWIQGQPVLPLSTWRYWTGPTVALGRDRGAECVSLLAAGEYPDHADCVLCGRRLERFDWWSLDGVSGPCCRHTEGCRQQQEETADG